MGNDVGRVCGSLAVGSDDDKGVWNAGFEYSWTQADGADGQTARLLTIPRGSTGIIDDDEGAQLDVKGLAIELAHMDMRRLTNPRATLITVAHESISSFNAPQGTSFRAWADAVGFDISQDKSSLPSGTLRLLSNSPPFSVIQVGSEWSRVALIEMTTPLTLEKLVGAHHAISSNVAGLVDAEARDNELMLPLIGFNEFGSVPLQSCLQELVSTAYNFHLRTDGGVGKISVVVPNGQCFRDVESEFRAMSDIVAVFNGLAHGNLKDLDVTPLAERIRGWMSAHMKDASYEIMESHLEAVMAAYDANKGGGVQGGKLSGRRQMVQVVCDAGLAIASSFVDQYGFIPEFAVIPDLKSKIRFLRYTKTNRNRQSNPNAEHDYITLRHLPGYDAGKASAEDKNNLTVGDAYNPSSMKQRLRKENAGVRERDRPFLSLNQFVQLENLRRIGFKSAHPVYSQSLNSADMTFCMISIIELLATLQSHKLR